MISSEGEQWGRDEIYPDKMWWLGYKIYSKYTYTGWWFQPLWKIMKVSWDYYSQYIKKTCSKPPTRYTWWIDVYEPNLYGKIYALGIKWYNVVPHS